MARSNGATMGLTWVAYQHTKHGARTRNAHAVMAWDPRAPSVVAVCGRTLPIVHHLKNDVLTLAPQPDRVQCGFCVEHLGRTHRGAVPHYRPPNPNDPASHMFAMDRRRVLGGGQSGEGD